ncbi:hypothetical protein [Nitrosomonas sp.]|uniref:hypothetical protein n=1 Tax=Nitrosomonas sp. TaxID=42353 RepID=UPI0025CD3561|nr:hypothetical protein [Nitrosomonas sp.]
MAEWKEWNGSREQLDEMRTAKEGFILRGIEHAYEKEITFHNISGLSCVDMSNVTHYLICQPVPQFDMRVRQAQTGQPVWWRAKDNHGECDCGCINIPWDYLGFDFSFTPFNEVKS